MLRRNWQILLLLIVVFGVIGVSGYTDPSGDNKQQGGSYASPLSSVSPDQTTDGSAKKQTTERAPHWSRLFVWPGGVETLGILATLIFIAWQAILTRQAITSAEKSSKVELRAYLIVTIANGTIQDRSKGLYFDGSPTLTNTGKTPAHKVRYRRHAAILTDPIGRNFKFPITDEGVGEYVVGMNVPFSILCLVEDFVDQQDVPDILQGKDNRHLWCWGVITYEDALGDEHRTEFCHRMWFPPHPTEEGQFKVSGNYAPGKNKAT